MERLVSTIAECARSLDIAANGMNHLFNFNREAAFGQNPGNTFLEGQANLQISEW